CIDGVLAISEAYTVPKVRRRQASCEIYPKVQFKAVASSLLQVIIVEKRNAIKCRHTGRSRYPRIHGSLRCPPQPSMSLDAHLHIKILHRKVRYLTADDCAPLIRLA